MSKSTANLFKSQNKEFVFVTSDQKNKVFTKISVNTKKI